MAGGMRTAGSVVIQFGLIRIPVKLYLAAAPITVSFNLLTADGHRVKQRWVDEETGRELDYDTLHRGKEVSKNNFVSFTKDEIEALSEDKKDTVELHSLVPVKDIDLSARAIEKTYFAGPGDGGDKAYRLFLGALVKSKKVAVAKYYARGKDNLVALLPTSDNDVLLMHQLYYQEERRTFTPTFAKGSEPSEEEVKMAVNLLKKLTRDEFNLADYQDEYGARVAEAVARKQAGIVSAKRAPGEEGKSLDLADLLLASLKEEKN